MPIPRMPVRRVESAEVQRSRIRQKLCLADRFRERI